MNGTLCGNNDPRLNNNDRSEMLQCPSVETKVIAEDETQEYIELFTTV